MEVGSANEKEKKKERNNHISHTVVYLVSQIEVLLVYSREDSSTVAFASPESKPILSGNFISGGNFSKLYSESERFDY